MSGLKENQNLPKVKEQVSSNMKSIAEHEVELNKFLRQLQNFQGVCNTPVEKGKLEEHPIVKGVYYLPISFMEMSLDVIYFGMWSMDNFKWQQIGNEMVGSIDLKVYHPITKEWITRTGAAAHVIMTDAIPEKEKKGMSNKEKNAWALNLENKKAGALANGGFSALKAECFKNACLSLGKYFGRDVNRKYFDNYNPLVSDVEDLREKKRKELSELIDLVQDEEMRYELVTSINEAEDKGLNTLEFYKKMINKIQKTENGKI